jgi:hypothetical protein
MEIRVGPSEVRGSPLRFNSRDTASCQRARTVDISGDDIAATSRKTSMAIFSTSEENEGTWGRASVGVSVSIGGSSPMNDGRFETTRIAAISQTNNVITFSSVISIEGSANVSFSPGDSLSAVSGVSEASRTVSTRRSGGRSAATSREASSTGRNPGTAYVSSLGRDMIPDISCARETRVSFTADLAVNVDFSISAERANE